MPKLIISTSNDEFFLLDDRYFCKFTSESQATSGNACWEYAFEFVTRWDFSLLDNFPMLWEVLKMSTMPTDFFLGLGLYVVV